MARQVLHVGVKAFGVAVERAVDPSLKGLPVVVSPFGGPRPLVAEASLEASREGIRVGMPLARARERCRRLVVLLGSKRALAMAIKNDQPVRRYTDLTAKLRQASR